MQPAEGSLTQKGAPWTAGEDDLLRTLVDRLGDKDWCVVAGTIKTHTPRQCRERYKNHVKPTLYKGARACPGTRRLEDHACYDPYLLFVAQGLSRKSRTVLSCMRRPPSGTSGSRLQKCYLVAQITPSRIAGTPTYCRCSHQQAGGLTSSAEIEQRSTNRQQAFHHRRARHHQCQRRLVLPMNRLDGAPRCALPKTFTWPCLPVMPRYIPLREHGDPRRCPRQQCQRLSSIT
jgi:hypothetical protein